MKAEVEMKAYALQEDTTGKWVVFSRQGQPLLVETPDVRCLRTLKAAKSYLRWRKRGGPHGPVNGFSVVMLDLAVTGINRVPLPEEGR